MRAKAKMGARCEDMKKRTKGLEIGKGGMYATPFRGAIVAMEAVPRRGVYREGGKKKEVKMSRNAPCGVAKRFDQTFSKFDAWCESMEGLQSAEMRGAMT